MRRTPAALAALISLALGAAPAAAQPDHPDDCAAAIPITIGSPALTGVIDPPTDRDWFVFDAAPGHLYEIHLLGASAGYGPELLITGADCAVPLMSAQTNDAHLSTPLGGPHRLCAYNFHTSTSGMGADSGLYTVHITDLGPDTDDAANHPATAASIPADGSPTTGRIDYQSDLDYYRIALQERTLYRLNVADLGCSTTYAHLFDRDGVTGLAYAFSFGSPGLPGGPCIEGWGEDGDFYVPTGAGGDYFLQLVGFPEPTTLYELTVTPMSTFLPDDDHPDTCESATPLTLNAPPVTGLLDPAADLDAFSFHAQAGHFYRIYGRTDVTILGPDCATSIAMPLQSDQPEFVAPTDGTYRIIVGSAFGRPSVYTLAVSDAGLVSDDHGNTPADATDISADGSPVNGQANYPSDADVFRFTLQPHTLYRVELRTPGCAGAWGYLFTSSGEPANDLRSTGGGPCSEGRIAEAIIYAPISVSQTYLLHVTGAVNAAYTVTVTPTIPFGPVDAHPDSCADAVPIAVNSAPLTATIDPPGDIDWFTFNAAAGHVYRLELPNSTDHWPIAEVRAAGCTDEDAVTVPGRVSHHSFRAAAGGAHHVGIRFFDFSWRTNQGPYSFRIVDLGPTTDDHADGPAGATRLRTDGVPATGRTDFAFDTDTFRLWLRPRTLYTIEVRADDCTTPWASLFTPGSYAHRASVSAIPAAGCDNPGYEPITFYTPAAEPGDYLLTVSNPDPGSTYTLSARPIGCTADFNHSGAVDSADISAFLSSWLAALTLPHPASLAADFNGDTLTNSSDISAFLAAWLAALTNGC